MLLGAFALQLGAQSGAPTQTIQLRPISTKIFYEHLVSNDISLGATVKLFPVFVNFQGDDGDGGIKFTNYSIAPEARFYLGKKEGLEGFYIAPYFKVGATVLKTTTTSDDGLREKARFKGHTLGAGFVFGWQWITDSGFTIGTGLGWGYNDFSFDDARVTYSDGTTEVENVDDLTLQFGLPVFRFSLGYAF